MMWCVTCGVMVRCIGSVFVFKQKTAYDMRISDWSSDVCSSDLLPQVERCVVSVIDGRGQSFGREAPGLGDQRPRMVDRLFLEIVAEGEIPQHFKESMMPRRIADII